MKNSHFKLLNGYQALGTYWWIDIFDEISLSIQHELQSNILQIIRSFESAYSRFKPNSLVSDLNNIGYITNASEEFVFILNKAIDYYHATDGQFNIATGHIQESNGYNSSYTFEPNTETPQTPALPSVLRIHGDTVELDTLAHIDIGGFGKGWLIDSISTYLKTNGFPYFLINGGGDIYVTSNRGAPVSINLEHPISQRSIIGSVLLKNQALAGSSPFKRAWRNSYQNTVLSHLIETASGSAQVHRNQLATFVVAATASDADAYATTIALLGRTKRTEIERLAKQQSIDFIAIDTDSHIHTSNKKILKNTYAYEKTH